MEHLVEWQILKKLTITVDADVYEGLHQAVGRRRISRFLNDLARPHVVAQKLAAGYAAMAADEAREAEAQVSDRLMAGTSPSLSCAACVPRIYPPRRPAAVSAPNR